LRPVLSLESRADKVASQRLCRIEYIHVSENTPHAP
jgi:hypothetical protein